ncbi:hypothetical protein ACQ7A7_26730, partial [Escherichia coli]
MRLHVKLKEFFSMFFIAILFFPAFNASLFFTCLLYTSDAADDSA